MNKPKKIEKELSDEAVATCYFRFDDGNGLGRALEGRRFKAGIRRSRTGDK